ncbi:ribonuclease H-like domain, reverse transcriptase, RNA-dependent DNA polymerase [Tanacetum coccineum]
MRSRRQDTMEEDALDEVRRDSDGEERRIVKHMRRYCKGSLRAQDCSDMLTHSKEDRDHAYTRLTTAKRIQAHMVISGVLKECSVDTMVGLVVTDYRDFVGARVWDLPDGFLGFVYLVEEHDVGCPLVDTLIIQRLLGEALFWASYESGGIKTIVFCRELRKVWLKAYAKVPSQHLTKLDDRSTKMVYLGNEQGSKAYRLFDPTTQRICVSRDVKFKEDETWDWKDYMKTQPIEDDNEFPNNDDDYASPSRDSPLHSQTPHTPSTQSSEINSQVTPNFSTQSYYQSDNDSTQIINSPSHFDHTPLRGFRTLSDLYENTEELLLAEDEPKNYKEASSDQKWIEAMKVELDSINRNNTWELTTLPKGHKAIGLKWVFKTKKDANGNIIKHKARLVAKGYIQQHGIDFEEVFAPVARMETIRLLLAIAANNKWEVHHLDVKSAFLHGDLKEEVYVTQPEGFVKRQDNGKVYRLIKALYGLRQAPRAWNIKLDNTLKSLDFKKCALEQAIYTKTSKDSTLLIGVYVDDLIITGTPKKEIDKFKAQMEEKFEMTLSSCESEFIAATATATQALWLKRLLSKLTHSQEEKVTIQVDNKSAITLMKNPVFHERSKHIDTKYHFIRECVEREDIQVEFLEFRSNKSIPVMSLNNLDEYAQTKLSDADAIAMISMVSDEEIKDAIFDIDSSKVAAQMGTLLASLRRHGVVLIDSPDKVSDFRPIACCNELLKGYNRKNGPKRCAMKIDIQKAYTSFSIRVNEEMCGFFKGGRGLRQGDPISPYLFTLVMEIFNIIMIKNIANASSFKYHYGCKELKLTHMCFDGDLMILCNGDTNSLKVIKESLEEFSNVSGLFPNLSKSTIFFGSINEDRKRDLLEVLPFRMLKEESIAGETSCYPMLEGLLIASVLSSMQQYWASIYMLPISVVKELDKLFKRFLWNSGNSAQGKSRIA